MRTSTPEIDAVLRAMSADELRRLPLVVAEELGARLEHLTEVERVLGEPSLRGKGEQAVARYFADRGPVRGESELAHKAARHALKVAYAADGGPFLPPDIDRARVALGLARKAGVEISVAPLPSKAADQ